MALIQWGALRINTNLKHMFGGIKQFGQQGAAAAKIVFLQKKIESKKVERRRGD